ncbi:hypothetical protein IQ07DRAFT_160172 [Pyrenochaeta sp. DS3sAY3a]|nr:hypothetical protein IQ07DRAFT_160172 [Pyrenochaeta sp. DS3sAY3a]
MVQPSRIGLRRGHDGEASGSSIIRRGRMRRHEGTLGSRRRGCAGEVERWSRPGSTIWGPPRCLTLAGVTSEASKLRLRSLAHSTAAWMRAGALEMHSREKPRFSHSGPVALAVPQAADDPPRGANLSTAKGHRGRSSEACLQCAFRKLD